MKNPVKQIYDFGRQAGGRLVAEGELIVEIKLDCLAIRLDG